MKSITKTWRESGWEKASVEEYTSAYTTFGGSFITHPEVLSAISSIANMPLEYLKQEDNGKLIGAIATWDKCLAGSKNGLKKAGKRSLIDIGNAEIILPLSRDQQFSIRHHGDNISELNNQLISNIKPADYEMAFAKPHMECSKKFRYNQRRELRLLEEAGASYRPIQELSALEISTAYKTLFKKRWDFDAKGHETMDKTIEMLKPFLIGYVLEMDNKAIAIQLVYMAESPDWLSIEYLNGGVDTDYQQLSPGSVLTYLNTQHAEALATEKNKSRRYSFGISDRDYKARWCNPSPVFQL
ncbi:hypothetical protein A9Q99_26185 [Gammaproteobacteria bacterium 45_16_T64]|nr:hypothetical protein A9Q99_26185 [Gammaproteobacteria bacterium 45_16_T64]